MPTVYSAKDSNGFRLRVDYTATTPNAASTSTSPRSTITGTMYLQSTVPGKYFSQWKLTGSLNIWGSHTTADTYPINFSAVQYAIANPTTTTPTNVSLGTFTRTIMHDPSDGTGYFYMWGKLDADTNASYVPANLEGFFDSYGNFNQFNLATISVAPPTPSYSYSYSNSYGSSTPTGGTVLSGTSISLGSPGTRTGYTFAGWNAYDSSTGSYLGNSSSNWTITAPTTFYDSWTPLQYTVTFYNSYGSLNNPSSTQTVNYGSTGTFPNPGSRTGYSFNGWDNNPNYYIGANTPTITGNTSYSANSAWTALAPGFTDESISGSVLINQNVNTMADYKFGASNANEYLIYSGGTGLNPTSWLSIDNSGYLSGSTSVAGTYTFTVVARNTATSQSVTSGVATLIVRYPGKRINSTFSPTNFTTAKRYDASTGWTPLTSMKRFVGIGQPGADANGWTNLTN